jgi:hypothetical protein
MRWKLTILCTKETRERWDGIGIYSARRKAPKGQQTIYITNVYMHPGRLNLTELQAHCPSTLKII